MNEPGSIHSKNAYAQGKMLDHSAWLKDEPLPRGITPSDIDMVIDDNGAMLFNELSSRHHRWHELSTGQRRLYEGLIFQTQHCAVLCKHSVPPAEEREINTRTDIDNFQVMLWQPSGLFFTEVFHGNSRWQQFVASWFVNADKVRSHCFSHPGNGEAA